MLDPGRARARAALTLAVLLLALAGDRMMATRAGIPLDLPPLMLWAWDRDDDLRFVDTSTTGVAYSRRHPDAAWRGRRSHPAP